MSIKYTTELNSMNYFIAWQGGKDVLNLVRRAGMILELDSLIEELQAADCEPWTETQLNDFLWFDLTEGAYEGFTWEELTEKAKKREEASND